MPGHVNCCAAGVRKAHVWFDLFQNKQYSGAGFHTPDRLARDKTKLFILHIDLFLFFYCSTLCPVKIVIH